MLLPLPPDLWALVPAQAQTPLLEQFAVLHDENRALRARIRNLEARLGQDSSNSSCPPSSDPPQAFVWPKAPPSGRTRGGQPGHPGACRALLPVEQVDEVVRVVPREGRTGGLPTLWATVPDCRRRSRPGVAAPGSGVAAAGRAGHRLPDGGAALPGMWATHPSGPAARRAPPIATAYLTRLLTAARGRIGESALHIWSRNRFPCCRGAPGGMKTTLQSVDGPTSEPPRGLLERCSQG